MWEVLLSVCSLTFSPPLAVAGDTGNTQHFATLDIPVPALYAALKRITPSSVTQWSVTEAFHNTKSA